MTSDEIGRVAYETFASIKGGVWVAWTSLDREEQESWISSAMAVVEHARSAEDRELMKTDGITRIPGLLVEGVFIARKPPWEPTVRIKVEASGG